MLTKNTISFEQLGLLVFNCQSTGSKIDFKSKSLGQVVEEVNPCHAELLIFSQSDCLIIVAHILNGKQCRSQLI